MALRFRPMQSGDVRECAEIIAAHPISGPRYGDRIGDLSKAWLRLLNFEAMHAIVFRAGDVPRAPICCVGVTVFVTDDFMREMKTPLGFWVGPELTKRILQGNSPILLDKQFRDANSCGGLNLVTWEGCFRSGYETNSEVTRYSMTKFVEIHRGFLLKEVTAAQVESVERLRWTVQTGGLLWNAKTSRYENSIQGDANEFIRKPHVVGTTRTIELNRPESWASSWVGALFDYDPPVCGFSRGEQRLLQAALAGESETDPELSETLGVSLPTIKKMWRSAYRRVLDRRPETIPENERAETAERGKEKRRHLLAYLRQHPEELRPVSQRLLGQQPRVTKRIHRVQG